MAENTIIVSDEGGRELWRKVFAGKLIFGDRDRSWIGDVDGDGRTEVLFDETPTSFGAPSTLHCYSQEGTERWQFKPGGRVRTAREDFTGPYSIVAMGVERLGRSKEMRIVVDGAHYLYYPSQIAMLAPDGHLIREYWHSGHLDFMHFSDVNGDDQPEIVAVGVHNASGSATLIALDPDTMGGASEEENKDYQLLGRPPANELARILFPRSCMNRKFEPFATVGKVWAEPGEINLEVTHRLTPPPRGDAGVYYHLNSDLSLKQFSAGSSFKARHESAFQKREIDHRLTKDELGKLAQLRYLRGGPAAQPARP